MPPWRLVLGVRACEHVRLDGSALRLPPLFSALATRPTAVPYWGPATLGGPGRARLPTPHKQKHPTCRA
eukprot:3798155-Prymnesium_polylepis.1